ncbi:ABC-type transport auxiliary lipoprotein family protein [Henriciella sp. AS95]|uniref:ABC-type transport auxiliary lipoprotein family protein n=1 Tax=Henriciella sp. AS95 TaxID=3135782 RepID=UPI0031737286
MRSLTPKVGLLALVCSLSACVSVLPEQPKPKALYQIGGPESQVSLSHHVVIREPDAPRLFASRNIAVKGPNDGLRIIEGVAWADRMTRLMQVAMIDAFSTDGKGIAVDDAAGVSGAAELYWRVPDLTLEGNEGVCELQLTLLDGRSREPLAQTTVRGRASASGEKAQARARALADAGQACIAKGAEFIAQEMAALDTDQ